MALRLIIAILILAVPVEISGCGPEFAGPLFSIPVRPDSPADFARGELGILKPTYERFYQVIAYRYLAGIGLNDAEQKAILATGPLPHDSEPSNGNRQTNPWLAARNQLKGITPIQYVQTDRLIQDPNRFEVFENCHNDAFTTAASTLDRIRKLGDPAVADWVAAQDVVFSDCSKGSDIPQPSSDPRLRADRAYQIASARFYSRQYDAALADFRSIAADKSSPWHEIAPYLTARCLLRIGNLAQAESELERISKDPALPRWHDPAIRLLNYVRVQAHPAGHMHDVALAIVKPNSQATLSQDLIDYRVLFDRGVVPQPNDELTDWIRSFQAGGKDALARWRAAKTLPWLVAALESVGPKNDAVPELLAAARELKPGSPAYVTASYHIVRLSPPDAARAKADALLAGTLSLSSRNQFRAERMKLATTFDDWLRYAPRRPAAEQDYEIHAVTTTSAQYFDTDSTGVLDGDLPLSALRHAAASDLLPPNLRAQLRQVISVREILIAKSPTFDQVWLLLHNPGMSPVVRSAYGRETKNVAEIDDFRDNWWCSQGTGAAGWQHNPRRAPGEFSLLSPAERTEAIAEQKQLAATPTAPDWLGARTIEFAEAHPQDPRVPEALHLVVRASRFGCTDDDTGKYSQQAFNILHRSYPTSDWTKKTPYWYK